MSSTQPQRPAKTLRAGGIKLAIWAHEGRQHDRPGYSMRLQKSYFDQDSKQWVETEFFRPSDILAILILLQEASRFTMLRSEDSTETSGTGQGGE